MALEVINNKYEKKGLSKPSRLMIRMVIVTALLIIVIGMIYYRSFAALPFALGVIVTSCLNIIKIRMLEQTVHKVMSMTDQDAGKNTVRLQYLLRYLLTGVVLVLVGLIQNYTTPPPFYSDRTWYIAVWAILFPGGSEAFLNAPFISIWGALAGLFTLQASIIIIRSMKLEKNGENFIKYDNDDQVIEPGDEQDTNTDKG